MIFADNCTDFDLIKYNVISSRIRLARNVSGLPFPKCGEVEFDEYLDIIKGAALATENLFDVNIYFMEKLSKEQRIALVERHIISMPLANNLATGAVILEKDSNSMSIMLNEEDHIREQCVVDGFNLEYAYQRISDYDDSLSKVLNIAYDGELGYLTACPTNVGTGMRASCMVFLPALKRLNAIDDTLEKFKKVYNLTIRGVYGENTGSFCDMYQVSNEATLGYSEDEIIKNVKNAVLDICYCERVAMQRLIETSSTKILDDISRSYAILSGGAYSLTEEELMDLIVNVKMGLILEVIPKELDVRVLDKLAQYVSPSTYEISNPGSTKEEQSILRAELVKKVFLGGVK